MRRRRNIIPIAMAPITAIPPITPPTIAPTGVVGPGTGWGSGVGVVGVGLIGVVVERGKVVVRGPGEGDEMETKVLDGVDPMAF